MIAVLNIFENSGAQYIQHVELYVNQFGHQIFNDRTETAIIYDKQTGVEIIDPYDLISSASVHPINIGTQAQFHFQITFEKEIEKSDILFRIWDAHRNSMDLHLDEALMVIPVEPSSKIIPKDDDVESDIISKDDDVESEKTLIPMDPEPGVNTGIQMDPEPGVNIKEKSLLDSITQFFSVLSKLLQF